MPSSNRFSIYLRYFISVLLVCLIIPPTFYNQPEGGLDNSWNIAINLAYKYHLQFGRDFAFTYGPLGFLNSRLPISINRFVFILFDIYLLSVLFIILREIFKDNFKLGTVLFIFLNIMLAQYALIYQWYFYFFFFFLFSFLKTPS